MSLGVYTYDLHKLLGYQLSLHYIDTICQTNSAIEIVACLIMSSQSFVHVDAITVL